MSGKYWEYVLLNDKLVHKPEFIEPEFIAPIIENEPITKPKITWFETPIAKPITKRPKKRYKVGLAREANKEIKQINKVNRYRRCYTCNKRFAVPDLADWAYHHCAKCR